MMKWCFWLLFFPLAAAMNFGYLLHPSPKSEHTWSSDGKTPWKKSPPHRETPCLWRTEKLQNCTPKMPKVTSETSCFCRDVCCRCWTPDGKTPCLWRTEKLQNGIPKMPNVTSETHRKRWWNDAFGCFFFPSCCCYEFWLPFPPAAAETFAAAAAGLRMGKHHGKNHLPAAKHHASAGRRRAKIAPRKCLT